MTGRTADHRGFRRYTTGAIWFHWTIGLLVIANLVIGVLHESLLKGTIPLHKSIGMTVLVLSIARLGWRLAHPAPPLPDDIPHWQKLAAHVSHWAFYFFIIALPLTGWVFSSAAEKRRPLTFFDLFDIPYLPVRQGPHLGDLPHDAHVVMGWTLLALVALHVGAALKHHFVDRDAVLARMAPVVEPPARA